MLESTNESEVTYVGNYRGQMRAESKFVIIVAVASIVLSCVATDATHNLFTATDMEKMETLFHFPKRC